MRTRPRKLLTFACGLLLAPSLAARAQELTFDDLLAYLHQHRNAVSVAAFTASARGGVDPDDPFLFHRPGVRRPLASAFKTVILAAYARQVSSGRLDPTEPVRLGDWERYYLPSTDEAHREATAALGIATDELGFALDPGQTVPIDLLARVMIRHSDNAATDFIAARVGSWAIHQTIVRAGLSGQDEPVSLLGLFLATHNFADGPLSWDRLRALRRLNRQQLTALCDDYAARYADPAWRQTQLEWLAVAPPPDYVLRAAAFDALFPRGTAADYASIFARLAAGTFFSQQVSAIMLAHLDQQVAADDPLFRYVAQKGGSGEGLLTMAALIVPKIGPLAGKPRVSIVFFEHLDEGAYSLFDQLEISSQLAALAALDPTSLSEVRQALRRR